MRTESCHYTDYTLTKLESCEYVAGAVNDPNGEWDVDGDGIPNELNIGCESCHGAGAAFKHQMRQDAVTPGSPYCQTCHTAQKDLAMHAEQAVGMAHGPDTKITCTNCHQFKTAQTGAGFGKGLVTDDGKNYWENDITFHLFIVPCKDSKHVKGVEPDKAMPIPYTNSCGISCHDPKSLK